MRFEGSLPAPRAPASHTKPSAADVQTIADHQRASGLLSIEHVLAQRNFRGIHRSVKILITCPAPARTRHGNRITALRWAGILRGLGHRVTIAERFAEHDCDLLIALHARKSAGSVETFRRVRPELPIVVALTGTDLYRDLRRCERARRALGHARRVVLLQPLGLRELPRALRSKARVIYQSAPGRSDQPRPAREVFEVAVIGHLRPVKDPMRAALAARRLPARSRIRVVHLGKAMTPALERRARTENARNPRYRWLGERPRREALARLARSRLLVLASRMEGGANVISESAAAGVPVLASRIPGSIGLLGADYPGYFEPGDTAGLARLLRRAERDTSFYARLARHCRKIARLFAPSRERAAWRRLLAELRDSPMISPAQPRRAAKESPTSRRRRRAGAGARSRSPRSPSRRAPRDRNGGRRRASPG